MSDQDVVDLDLEPIVESLVARSNGTYNDVFVRSLVEQVAKEFESARVRDYLPVLITKESAGELRRLGGMVSTTS
jgi:hypothetical protein